MPFCHECGSELKQGAVFCSRCGKPVTAQNLYCNRCGHEIKPGTVFCGKCGNPVNGGAANAAPEQTQGFEPARANPPVSPEDSSDVRTFAPAGNAGQGNYTPVRNTQPFRAAPAGYGQAAGCFAAAPDYGSPLFKIAAALFIATAMFEPAGILLYSLFNDQINELNEHIPGSYVTFNWILISLLILTGGLLTFLLKPKERPAAQGKNTGLLVLKTVWFASLIFIALIYVLFAAFYFSDYSGFKSNFYNMSSYRLIYPLSKFIYYPEVLFALIIAALSVSGVMIAMFERKPFAWELYVSAAVCFSIYLFPYTIWRLSGQKETQSDPMEFVLLTGLLFLVALAVFLVSRYLIPKNASVWIVIGIAAAVAVAYIAAAVKNLRYISEMISIGFYFSNIVYYSEISSFIFAMVELAALVLLALSIKPVKKESV